MSEHTPGPWEWSGNGEIGEWGQLNSADGETEIAWAKCDGEYGDPIFIDNDADAHLIKAAPDMYEALKELRASMHCRGPFDFDSCEHRRCDCDVCRRAEAALKKAEGES